MQNKIRVPQYTMKLRIYPNEEQKQTFERFFRALQIAYNITFHEVFQKNEAVCKAPDKNGNVRPDFDKMARKEWSEYLIAQNPRVADAPAAARTTKNGLFKADAARAWKEGKEIPPIKPEKRKDFRFYNSNKPRRSFAVQLSPKRIIPSPDNPKVVWITLPKVNGRIKARGFNRKLWFGENNDLTYEQAIAEKVLSKDLTVRVSKDTCGDYYISITFIADKENGRFLSLESKTAQQTQEIGIDVGIKDVAILSTGQKVENKHFKKAKDATLRKLNKQLSNRWGPANSAFRDYNKDIRKENRQAPETPPKTLAAPSKRYTATKLKKARIERTIARRRETYYHQQTAAIVERSSLIAVETLRVKNMLHNHKLAYALSDAAMSDFISMLDYKAKRRKIQILRIGTYEPSSQLCSVCGTLYPKAKNLSVRSWTCPSCGAMHDRDVNAAINILNIAKSGKTSDDPEQPTRDKRRNVQRPPGRPGEHPVSDEAPELVIVFSKELTRLNDPRYVIIDKKTRGIVDNAQGVGYRSISNARNCYKAKKKWSAKQA